MEIMNILKPIKYGWIDKKGNKYYNNDGDLCKNKEKAIELWLKSAALGSDQAIFNLAVCNHTGDGVKKNMNEAVELYRKAVDLGNLAAMNNLGKCYEIGDGVEKDYEKALELYDDDEISEAKKLFKESFQKGNMDSAYMLGIMYLDAYIDLGFKNQPVHEAKRYFEAGAKKGHKECKRELAIILTKEQEYDKAIINFLESGDYSKEEICKDNLDPMLRMKKCDELVDCESIINYLDTINSKCDREDINAVIIRNISRYIKLYDDRFLYKVNNEDEFQKIDENGVIYLPEEPIK